MLIPVVGTISENIILPNEKQLYYSLAIGANWGDNLTPLGDNILVLNLAEKNKRTISFKQFFKLGFITTFYQLCVVSVFYMYVFLSIFHWISANYHHSIIMRFNLSFPKI